MRVGTKSALFGVHCFALHWMFVAIGWWRVYGFPWDPRLWVAFLVHDLGYFGKENMDGPEGELHPYLGAGIMTFWFDWPYLTFKKPNQFGKWFYFTLLHSRYLAKKLNQQPSRLAIADKMAIAVEPSWLYLPRAIASGEIEEFYQMALKCDPDKGGDFGIPGTREALTDILIGGQTRNPWRWHAGVKAYMRIWVEQHKDGAPDMMTSATRGN
jgi:hypothetical protein